MKKHTFHAGKIIAVCKNYDKCEFPVANTAITVTFDGKGAITSYAVADEKSYFDIGYFAVYAENKPFSAFADKTVTMYGRCQELSVKEGKNKFSVQHFLSENDNGVYTIYTNDGEDALKVAVYNPAFGNLSMGDGCAAGSLVYVACDGKFTCAGENEAVYISLEPGESSASFISFGTNAEYAEKCVKEASRQKKIHDEAFSSVVLPENLTEKQKAIYLSCYYCALQNFKSKGDYAGFMAGIHYLLPMRTYYRDSYFTVLPMYNGNAEKVKRQIKTLACGISAEYDCPSAVKSDYSPWWGNHYDSPSFFVMAVYDYVTFTSDEAILREEYNGHTLQNLLLGVMEKLSACCDETGLLVKSGKYNKRDWADEVNRYGYVTYDEILYARALDCLAKLFSLTGDFKHAEEYACRADAVKQAIDEMLWDDELGYYVNFKNEDYTEKNLSIDTVFAAVFDIADDQKARRMLRAMERVLEVRNNPEMACDDYGVMCVYPPYSRIDSSARKSSQPQYYHNGANWIYLTAMYAYAKKKAGMEYDHALYGWFDYSIEHGWYSPVEFFSAIQDRGSLLQGWSAVAAFVMDGGYSAYTKKQ